MMKELNWNIFEAKFNGTQQIAFERLSYALFCSQFSNKNGIERYKNQIGIETEPIEDNGKLIGFQSKYLEPQVSLSSRKGLIINSLKKAKAKNPNLNEIYVFINKEFSESSKPNQKSPKYKLEIEQVAKQLNMKLLWQVPSHIQKQLSLSINSGTAKEFFPDFNDLLKQEILSKDKNELLRITKTAIIQLEIEKIKEEYYENDWQKKSDILGKLYRYTNHSNEIIADSIFSFLYNASSQIRANMPSNIAGSIHSLILTFFPSSYETEKDERIENGKQCIYIGYNLVYDALIKINHLGIAEYGLAIWKFIYRESKRNNMPDLVDAVLKQYEELEQTLERPERNDLGNAKLLVKTFKDDLGTYDLSFPVLPEHLYKLTNKE